MRHEKPDHTLQATALVREAYMRLVDERSEWKSRSLFFAIAAQMMRTFLLTTPTPSVQASGVPALPWFPSMNP